MSTHRWIDRICAMITVLSLIVTVLFMNGEKLGIKLVSDTDAESYQGDEYFTSNDLNGDWDTSEATFIALSGDSAKISGNGAYWLDGSLFIVQTGQYVITGELTDGNIVVDAARYSKVWILLNGVTIHCDDDACIRVDQADKVFLTLADGTENTLTGGEAFSEAALADGTNAVIFSHDDLTINGSGSLNVVSSVLNAITSKDDLIITGGTISLTAPNHGIRVNDHFRMTAADVTISAGQDGIHAEGDIVIRDGILTITAEDDAIHSDASALIQGGTILVNDCYEGIEALTIEISGGELTIHARDDGLNANGYTGIGFGDEADMTALMPNQMQEQMQGQPQGQMPVQMQGLPQDQMPAQPPEQASAQTSEQTSEQSSEQASEQLQEAYITPFSNEFMPETGSLPMAWPDGNPADTVEEKTIVSVEDTWVLISGGQLTILNESGVDADGIDSNGDITITGGTILVSMSCNTGNNALDSGSESGGVMTITGGTLIACGDSGMAESFGSDSTQASILYFLSESAAEGSAVTLLNAEGEALISETIPYSFSAMVISCPDLTVGETYTLRIGETEESIEVSTLSVSAGEASVAAMMQEPGMPGLEAMGFSGFGNGETPPERPDGEEAFGQPPEFPNSSDSSGPPPEFPNSSDSSGPSTEFPNGADSSGQPPEFPNGANSSGQPLEFPNSADSSGPSPVSGLERIEDPSEANETAGETASAQPAAASDGTAWMLVLGSVLFLALGLGIALLYKRSQHIDT